jgi:hypothetical protein
LSTFNEPSSSIENVPGDCYRIRFFENCEIDNSLPNPGGRAIDGCTFDH